MTVPGIVQSALGGEDVAAQVDLGGEDELYVTPTRTLIFRGEGLLSDESVEEYPHEAERVEISRGRRKAKISLDHSIEGERTFSLPAARLDDALHPVLAGVLNAAGVTETGETVKRTYLFSELTLIVTSRRLVNHVGQAVWDVDYEEYPFEDATDLDFEQGSVATQIVLEVGGRRERIKAPNDEAPAVRAELEEALFEFHGVDDVQQLREKTAAETATGPSDPDPDPDPDPEPEPDDEVSFGGGVEPLSTGRDDGDAHGSDADTRAGGTDAGGAPAAATEPSGSTDADRENSAGRADASTGDGETATADPPDPASATPASVEGSELDAEAGVSNEEIAEQLDDLTTAVQRQNELLATHADTIERLIEELKRM